MAKHREPSHDEFMKDVAQHEVKILLDNDIYRHLRCKQPGSSCYWFDIITAPGILVFTGDMSGFTFRRLYDMFEFFRNDSCGINPSYWAEKVEAECRGSGVEKFSEDKFKRIVFECVRDWIRDHRDECTRAERRELWEQIESDVLFYDDSDSYGVRLIDAAIGFEHMLNSQCKFRFEEFWEHNFNDYTFRFIWCCRAIVWAIAQYDAQRKAKAVAA